MARTFSQKSSYRLLLWGLLLIPFAAVADSVLDAVIFGAGTIQQRLFNPSYHELSARMLFSIFILAAICLGMHFLANTSQKEQSLQQRNKDLSLAKQDIEEIQEEFTRHLRNTAAELGTSIELLKTQCAKDLDEKTLFFLGGITKTTEKLNKHLETGQELAGLPAGELHRERVKIDKLAQEIAGEIKGKQTEVELNFTIQPWITCYCDKELIRLVIYNLFCNALASIPAHRSGQIELGLFYSNEKKVFFVRDNGAGFNEAQAKRLFDPFRDSSQDPNLPQDTTRLASAKRIISRHGGKIWAEGVEGSGGSIFFTLQAT